LSRFRTTNEADEDLIAAYIQGHDRFGKSQADRYQDGLEATFQSLAEHPQRVRLRMEFHPPIRVFSYGSHVILYDEEPNGIAIVRVRHGHDDWQGDLDNRSAAEDAK